MFNKTNRVKKNKSVSDFHSRTTKQEWKKGLNFFDLQFNYQNSDSELGNEAESDLNMWLRRNGSWTNLNGTVDRNKNYLEVSGYNFTSGVLDTIVLSDALDDYALPVELVAFEAMSDMGIVKLYWMTASELSNAYFIVERSEKENDGYKKVKMIEPSATIFFRRLRLAACVYNER